MTASWPRLPFLYISTLLFTLGPLPGQTPQNPSPMVDHTRAHRRPEQRQSRARRWQLSLGDLVVREGTNLRKPLTLVVHFHGTPWLAEQSVLGRSKRAAVIAIQIGSGSGVYSRAFEDPRRFRALLDEARAACSCRFNRVLLTSFSAGYGAIRAILAHDGARISGVVLADSLHAGYNAERQPEAEDLRAFVDFARHAAAGRKQMLVTHSEVYPGTYASTTETADALLDAVGLHRKAVLRWGPLGMQQLSEARRRRFTLLGFAGNSAPDHVDHFQALGWWLRRVAL